MATTITVVTSPTTATLIDASRWTGKLHGTIQANTASRNEMRYTQANAAKLPKIHEAILKDA